MGIYAYRKLKYLIFMQTLCIQYGDEKLASSAPKKMAQNCKKNCMAEIICTMFYTNRISYLAFAILKNFSSLFTVFHTLVHTRCIFVPSCIRTFSIAPKLNENICNALQSRVAVMMKAFCSRKS